MPIEWEELERPLDPAAFTIKTAPARVAGRQDPWAEMARVGQRLPTPQ
jgi:DNA primase